MCMPVTQYIHTQNCCIQPFIIMPCPPVVFLILFIKFSALKIIQPKRFLLYGKPNSTKTIPYCSLHWQSEYNIAFVSHSVNKDLLLHFYKIYGKDFLAMVNLTAPKVNSVRYLQSFLTSMCIYLVISNRKRQPSQNVAELKK